jgi:hypothetical protein
MSGPKVFHVVTREELVARCEAHLRQLDAAIAEWTKACKRNGAADADDTEAVASRRDALRRMLKDGRFSELQKQVPAELSFLRADAQARIERAASAAAQVMQNRRRTAHTARTLLEALGKSGRRVPEDLRRALESTESIANTEAAIARAFALLAPVAASRVATDRQRELASKLGRDEKRATLAEWLANQPALAEGGCYLQIDRHLAELSALDVDPSPFTARAAAIAGELPPRQALLADSLLVDLAHAVKEARERSARLRGLGERAAELAQHGSAVAQALRSRIEVAIAAKDASSAPALISEADALVQEELRVLAADARRRAVLQGLASLGYEVSEGMATAWVQGGQVVLRKAATPDYGVELGGGMKSERLQVRAVAFGSAQTPRNALRDRDVEAIWCSEFEQLRTLLSKSGGGIEIEHALPVGATPLKLIEDPKRLDETGEGKTLRTMRADQRPS